jgi:hypothetical protein
MKLISTKTLFLSTLMLLVALAPSAQAGKPNLLSSNHLRPVHVPIWIPNSLAAIYQYDDETAEDAVGFGNGLENFAAIWFNQFDVIPGQNVIVSVSIAWGAPDNLTPADQINGQPTTLGIWSDPNGDRNPSDAVLLSSAPGVMNSANTDTFITYTFPSPVVIPGGSFFIGDVTPDATPERNFQALDQTSSAVSSWVAAMGDGSPVDINNIGNNDFLGTIDFFGLPGNWLIRAESGPLGLVRVVSEKNGWDINLPLDGTGVEDRSGAPNGEYNLHFAFSAPLLSISDVTTSCGTASFVIGSPDSSRVEVDLTGVDCNENRITVTLQGVTDVDGNVLPSVPITFGLLVGDITGDGAVDRADYLRTKDQLGETVNQRNFRLDISPKDPTHIDISDLNLVKRQRGTRLP